LQKFLIKPAQGGAAAKEQVGGELSLIDVPVGLLAGELLTQVQRRHDETRKLDQKAAYCVHGILPSLGDLSTNHSGGRMPYLLQDSLEDFPTCRCRQEQLGPGRRDPRDDFAPRIIAAPGA